MADYYTKGCVTEPVKDVPEPVYELLRLLTTNQLDEAREFLDTIEGEKLIESLVRYGVLEEGVMPEDVVGADDWEGQGDYTWPEDITNAATEMDVSKYQSENGEVHIFWEESLSDGSGPILQWLLSQLPEETKFLRVEASHDASRALFDAYGGFCVVVTREEVHWLHASAAADRIERVVEGKIIPVERILEDLLDDWSDRQVLGALAAFIEKNGLDADLRRYLVGVLEGADGQPDGDEFQQWCRANELDEDDRDVWRQWRDIRARKQE